MCSMQTAPLGRACFKIKSNLPTTRVIVSKQNYNARSIKIFLGWDAVLPIQMLCYTFQLTQIFKSLIIITSWHNQDPVLHQNNLIVLLKWYAPHNPQTPNRLLVLVPQLQTRYKTNIEVLCVYECETAIWLWILLINSFPYHSILMKGSHKIK